MRSKAQGSLAVFFLLPVLLYDILLAHFTFLRDIRRSIWGWRYGVGLDHVGLV